MTSSSSRNRDFREASGEASLDTLFDALAHRRRRYAVKSLHEARTPMALADLAREVAAREHGMEAPDVPAEDVEQTYSSLAHVHVPKLADADVVEYDRERETVAPSTESERVEPLVERAMVNEFPSTDS